ncbi:MULTISPECIES: hypothetical protein [Planktothricoides]|nr:MULTISPECIES: hypothetical protein [Planktothricoides]
MAQINQVYLSILQPSPLPLADGTGDKRYGYARIWLVVAIEATPI